MAKQRMVDPKLWSDQWVRKLNPLDRYLFLYLLTNERSSWCGVYELDLGVMAFESGIDERDLEKSMLPRLSPKVLYVDGWVCFQNWEKYHNNGSEQTKKGIENAWGAVPEKIRLKISKLLKTSRPPIDPLQGTTSLTSSFTSSFTPPEYIASEDPVADDVEFIPEPSEIRKKKEVFILPDWLDKEIWSEWESYRASIRKKLTVASIKLQIRMLDQNRGSHRAIIENSIKNGWTGLFPLDERKNPGQKPVGNVWSDKKSTQIQDFIRSKKKQS